MRRSMGILAVICAAAPALAREPGQAGTLASSLRLSSDVLALSASSASERTEVSAPPRRSVAWAFVPFGVGQFANEQPVKGTLFFVGETAAFSLAAGALIAFESNKTSGGFFQGGTFDDPVLADRLQATYLVAFWSGVGLLAVGFVDALLSRRGADPPQTGALLFSPGGMVVRF